MSYAIVFSSKNSTTENTKKVSMAKVILSVCCVRKLFTRLWSFILCIKSPMINILKPNAKLYFSKYI